MPPQRQPRLALESDYGVEVYLPIPPPHQVQVGAQDQDKGVDHDTQMLPRLAVLHQV